MRFWPRKTSARARRPTAEERRASPRTPDPTTATAFGNWGPDNVPAALAPKDDPSKSQVFEDEIDPSWRDPGTAD